MSLTMIKHFFIIIILGVYANAVLRNLTNVSEPTLEDRRIDMIVDIITLNLKVNGWNTILCYGNLPDVFYNKIKHIPYAFVIMHLNNPEQNEFEDIVPYHSNIIIINCQDIEEYEEIMVDLLNSPYWHPLSNVIIYYHKMETTEIIAKVFFSLWYYRSINSIIVQYDDEQQTLLVTDYTPYVNENYKFQPEKKFGCWTTRNIGMPVTGFAEGFTCVEKCHNVSIQTKLRANNLGTCIGYNTNNVSYTAIPDLRNLKLFEDRSKDLHGFELRAYATPVKPFFVIKEHDNGTYSLHARDGMIWDTMSKLMNFRIDLTPSMDVIKKPFNFELSITHIFSFSFRKADLCLFPIYQFDISVMELDFTFPYKDSGVCIMASRAGFETTIFDAKSLEANYEFLVKFFICFVCIWATFSTYKYAENDRLSFDQIGKDLMNTWRNVLLINLYKPPKRETFRIFLALSLWSFFVVNFISQATIISFFTAIKRGKEVETFEDIIEKGYPIEGMASPDLILPDTEERFRLINSKLVSVTDIFGCVRRMLNDTHRFCLIDCSVGRYTQRNKLNEKGEQYLHIARDRMHSHYLTMVFTKNSPFTDRYNKYIMIITEAGLIRKWEQYRYADIKDEVTTKPLGMEDLNGIFKLYCFCVALTFIIFLLELLIYHIKRFLSMFSKLKSQKNRRAAKKKSLGMKKLFPKIQ